MNCNEIETYAPLWHTGELDSTQKAAFDAHLADCLTCSALVKEQLALDFRIRAAETLPDTSALETGVVRRIAAERQRRRYLVLAAAAAILLAVFAGYRFRTPRILLDAARDHRVEVMEHQPRRWQTELTQFESRFGVSPEKAASLAPEGYRLLHARICRLDAQPALHLVFTDGTHELSVFLRKDSSAAVAQREASVGGEFIAFARSARYTTVAVSTGSAAECEAVVRRAASLL